MAGPENQRVSIMNFEDGIKIYFPNRVSKIVNQATKNIKLFTRQKTKMPCSANIKGVPEKLKVSIF